MADTRAKTLADFITLNPIGNQLSHAVLMSASFERGQFDDAFFAQTSIFLPDNISRASDKRQAEFFAGRYLADLAMRHYGIEQFELLADDKRCPLWPAEFTGSITHTDGFAACALAPKSQLSAIGIDSQELLTPTRAERLWSKIIDEGELKITNKADLELSYALTLCFSAKESIYKALYPFIGQFFGFGAATLRGLDLEQQIMEFHFSPELAEKIGLHSTLKVNYRHDGNRILSHIALSPEQFHSAPN